VLADFLMKNLYFVDKMLLFFRKSDQPAIFTDSSKKSIELSVYGCVPTKQKMKDGTVTYGTLR
jgi:hypothetical protein